MVLTELKPGEKAQILDLSKGERAKRRMVDLGLIPGTVIEMIAYHPFGGPVLIKVGCSHVALGRGLANSIIVARLDST